MTEQEFNRLATENLPARTSLLGQPLDTRNRFVSKGQSLEDRLWAGIVVKTQAECWLWTGARTTRGRRNVSYGSINEGSVDGGNSKRTWRVHIVMLLLKLETLDECPRDPGEELIPWLRRARRYFVEIQGMEAAHGCDNSLCCNPGHLEWETHEQNLADQRWRNEQRAKDSRWKPICCGG